jgi:hypothetical protein
MIRSPVLESDGMSMRVQGLKIENENSINVSRLSSSSILTINYLYFRGDHYEQGKILPFLYLYLFLLIYQKHT